MENSFSAMPKPMIQETNPKQEKLVQDYYFRKKRLQDLNKITKKGQDHRVKNFNPHVSMQHSYLPMRLIGNHHCRQLLILVDSGSTHNFLDLSVARSFSNCFKMSDPIAVSVANGDEVMCYFQGLGFEWSMQNQRFKADFLCLPNLGGHEMILGMQWLSTLGDVLWNFKALTMIFVLDRQLHELHGIQEEDENVMGKHSQASNSTH